VEWDEGTVLDWHGENTNRRKTVLDWYGDNTNWRETPTGGKADRYGENTNRRVVHYIGGKVTGMLKTPTRGKPEGKLTGMFSTPTRGGSRSYQRMTLNGGMGRGNGIGPLW